jgi:hypothetical protein
MLGGDQGNTLEHAAGPYDYWGLTGEWVELGRRVWLGVFPMAGMHKPTGCAQSSQGRLHAGGGPFDSTLCGLAVCRYAADSGR